MSLANPFQFLVDYYFFEDQYYSVGNLFICTSQISGQKYRIQKTDTGGFRVDLKVQHNDTAVWERQMIVADIQSTLGVVDDCEEKWRKRQKKKQKENRINDA